MPKESKRNLRVAELIQRELAAILQHDWRKPDLGLVTISQVRVNPDLQYARVFVSVFNSQYDTSETLKLLNDEKGQFRTKLAKRVTLRYVPDLKFFYDDTLDRTEQLDKLLSDPKLIDKS